jgi:DNA-binding transcriptional MerR regulator
LKTTIELLKETGLSHPMLNRLKDLGIVPKPKLKGLGRHKGVIGEFEDDVVDLIKWVRKQQADNISLVQIAEQLRKAKIEEGEVVGPKLDSSLVKWATQRFIELHARYPDHDFVIGEIDEALEEQPDGMVVGKFRIIRVPRK